MFSVILYIYMEQIHSRSRKTSTFMLDCVSVCFANFIELYKKARGKENLNDFKCESIKRWINTIQWRMAVDWYILYDLTKIKSLHMKNAIQLKNSHIYFGALCVMAPWQRGTTLVGSHISPCIWGFPFATAYIVIKIGEVKKNHRKIVEKTECFSLFSRCRTVSGKP